MKHFSTETDRVEAFSDGVFAVIITIMVLELRPPQGTELRSLVEALPSIATYALSFVFTGIYWNNHHHMLRASRGVDSRAMWANLNLLFWLSLIPFSTAWLGRNPWAAGPTAFYAIVFLLNAIAYTLLKGSLVRIHDREAPFAKAVATDLKGRISLAIYLVAIPFAFWYPAVCDVLLLTVAVIWFVPDRRFEPLIGLDR